MLYEVQRLLDFLLLEQNPLIVIIIDYSQMQSKLLLKRLEPH